MRSAFLRIDTLVFTILILAGTATTAAAADGVVLHEGRFDPRDLVWESVGDGSVRPTLVGTRHLALPGAPDLPVAELQFLVPADRTVTGVVVEPLAVHQESRPGTLAAAPVALFDSGEEAPWRGDGAKVKATWGENRGTHTWRGYRLLSVHVRPVRPAAGDPDAVEFLDAYAVRVTYGPAPAAEDVARRRRLVPGEAARNEAMLAAVVANGEAIAGYAREQGVVVETTEKGFIPTPLPSLEGSAVRYLIITNQTMAPQFQRLADHKTSLGMPTVVVTREFIAANYRHGADIQETIRMFIRESYERWGTEFVLLGADSDVLPPRYVDNSLYPAGGSTLIPTELYFACLDGNWNANGNGAYGEPGTTTVVSDEADFAEEVYLGRAPVNTVAQATVFVDKVIAYETVPANAGWPNRVLFAAEVLFPDPWGPGDPINLDGATYPELQVNNSIIPCTSMDYLRMYETFDNYTGDMYLTHGALVDSLNAGHYGIVNQVGHGYYYNMSVGDKSFVNSDADALVNGNHYFMIYALNCASAAFDYSCLMERLLQNPNGGAVSAIGSVRATFPVTANNYQQQFFSELYCQAESRQGTLVALSRLPYLGATDINYTDRWTFENYTLLGDPTMPLWTSRPRTANVSRPSSIGLGPQQVTITVTSGGSPVAGADVCLTKAGEDWATGQTNLSGQVTLDLLPVSTGNVQVRVSGRNLAVTERTIPVTSGGTYLAVTLAPVTDNGSNGSSGNGNGLIEAGETIALLPVIQETGGSGATGITGTLSTTTPGVTITTANASFGNVAAGGATVAQTPFRFTVAADVADGTPLTFVFNLSAGAGVYRSEQSTTIKAPELEIVAIDWEDATWGNGNGLVENGERLGVTFRAKNFGGGRADAITARLRTSDGNIVLYDTLTVLPALDSLDESYGAAVFSQALLASTRQSLSRIELVDNYGRTVRQTFYVNRPEAPTVIETDASQGEDVISLVWDRSASPDVVGYDVYRSQSPNSGFAKVNKDLVVGTTYFRDEGLAQLTKYYYRVTAVDSVLVPSVPTAAVGQSTAPPELAAFPVSFADETSSHLAIGDVDNDGRNEVVLAADEVYVWHVDGSELKDGDGNSQTLGPLTDLNSILQPAGVVLAPLDGVPGLEMIISERGNTSAIHIFNREGDELPGWPRSLLGVPGTKWNWATPAVGDIDGDGELEIVVNTLNGRVWAWNIDGTEVRDGDNNPATVGVLYFRPGADFEWSMSGPALYDLDGDGALDIIFGTRNDNTGLRRVMAIRYDGTDLPGFPRTVTGQVLCHPAVGDLNNDGSQEIVVFTSARWVYVFQEDGSDFPGFPRYPGMSVTTEPVTSPALGDLDNDGQLEIVIAGNQDGDNSALWAIDTNGTVMSGWPQPLPGSSEGSPVLADINGDGNVDIIHGIGGGSETAPNNIYAFNPNGTPIDGFPIGLNGPCMPSVTVSDFDVDGDVDIVYGGWDRLVHVWDMPSAFNPVKSPWRTFQNNVQRTGVFFPIELMDVGEDPTDVPPAGFTVTQPYPNPFNPVTTVRLYVPRAGDLELVVHDVRGRRVRTLHAGPIAAGWHTLTWNGQDDAGRVQASGVYFMRALSDQDVTIHKMTLVK